ncbi:MAG: bacillithiol transferase BstA [Rhodothermales bacterium]|nr:bacillithiol transferase BstA [Rhodothermales bacterium]
MTDPTDLRYPVGRFERPEEPVTPAQRRAWIGALEAAPAQLRAAAEGLTDAQLDTPYRPGGWTVRQVIHHVPDSHLNAYVRCKWALTEDAPAIKTYDEKAWAEQPEARTGPIAPSLALLEALHTRWVAALHALPADAFQRTIRHPEWGSISLDALLALYAWHGRHHVAHITALRAREGW